jgi:ABC-type transport system involved in multi-copper enzyme maturation permease subunit
LFLLALCLTSLFSGERAAKMDDMLLCAAGRRQAAAAKLLAALAVSFALYLQFYGLQILIVALTYGLDGASLSAHTAWSWLAVFSGRTLGGIFGGVALAALAALLASAFLAAFSSAVFRNTLVALLVYAAFVAAQIVSVNIAMNGDMWGFSDGPVRETVSRIIYLFPANVLFDGSNGSQIMILSSLRNVGISLAVSVSLVVASAALAPAMYLKRRKA